VNRSISKSLRALAFLLAISLAPLAGGVELTGKVVRVIDGDTIHVVRNDHLYKIRLGGIDAPESGQPYGDASKQYLAKLVADKSVKIEILKRDRYDRLIGKVWVQPQDCTSCAETLDTNHAQILAGMAWWYEYYAKDQSPEDRGRYQSAEEEARGRGWGLWQDAHPVPPWDWRRGARAPLPTAESDSGECGEKRYCRQMKSCEEARFYLNTCGLTSLDGDGDGMPCEKLCR
jgi:endonuclease YncB( thermonuclease family)